MKPERIWIEDERSIGGTVHVSEEPLKEDEYTTGYVRSDLCPMTTAHRSHDMTDHEQRVQAETKGAPEAIWALRSGDWGWDSFTASSRRSNMLPVVHYIRADLARPSQAGDERVAREARSAALREVDAMVEAFGPKRGNRWINRADLRAALAAMDTPKRGGDGWQPIETAPNDQKIIVAYDDGSIEMISAEDNDYEWEKYEGPKEWCTLPTHWMPCPSLPPAAMKEDE